MGLDMYLDKVRKIEGMSLKEILSTYENIEAKKNGYTYEEWCGGNPDHVCEDREDEVSKLEHISVPAWCGDDYREKYLATARPNITENIAYWRKANQIHNWFVENVQDGNDDCGVYEVTKDKLSELLDIAIEVRDASELIKGRIKNGESYSPETGWKINYQEGKIIKDPSTAKKLLPCTEGFFFGSTEYDEWYYDDIISTINQLIKVLKETDFDNETIYYCSSW